ncbi:hypothetical protein BT63DRAFT_304393 [Microthyrium microscopicum]|uniref:Uncharacterized protein n=1 Tax=Microthyrium microscopicum TaxID=703497 RepID=A0A6A6U9A9_9PEZI|nr:hypothetical protein BT63DRAFT_304393 [Microthyrium microscopicum]
MYYGVPIQEIAKKGTKTRMRQLERLKSSGEQEAALPSKSYLKTVLSPCHPDGYSLLSLPHPFESRCPAYTRRLSLQFVLGFKGQSGCISCGCPTSKHFLALRSPLFWTLSLNSQPLHRNLRMLYALHLKIRLPDLEAACFCLPSLIDVPETGGELPKRNRSEGSLVTGGRILLWH